jgi:hypothetical protein
MMPRQALYVSLACLLLADSSAEPRTHSRYGVPRGVTAFATWQAPRNTKEIQPRLDAAPRSMQFFASNFENDGDKNDDPYGAVDMAVEEVMSRKQGGSANVLADYNVTVLVEEAFAPMEASLVQMEDALIKARASMKEAKLQAAQAIEAIQVAAIAQAAGAAEAVAAAEEVAARKVLADIYDSVDVDVTTLTYDALDTIKVKWSLHTLAKISA